MKNVLDVMDEAVEAAHRAITQERVRLDAIGGPKYFGGQGYDLCGNSHIVVSGNSKLVRDLKRLLVKRYGRLDTGKWFLMQTSPGYWICVRTGWQEACFNRVASEAMLKVLVEENWAPEGARVSGYID
jgi:hypothetical protein